MFQIFLPVQQMMPILWLRVTYQMGRKSQAMLNHSPRKKVRNIWIYTLELPFSKRNLTFHEIYLSLKVIAKTECDLFPSSIVEQHALCDEIIPWLSTVVDNGNDIMKWYFFFYLQPCLSQRNISTLLKTQFWIQR